MAVKLTNPQRELLALIALRDQPVTADYGPAKALVRQEYAEWKEAMFCGVLAITPAGRQALQEQGS